MEAIGVADLLQVLEGGAYVGFIAGAIFAVIAAAACVIPRQSSQGRM
jgi:hypothetical protein